VLVACSPSDGQDGVDGARVVESTMSAPGPVAGGVGDDATGWRSARVVDGDTLDVSGPGGEVTVRIVGINAPEAGECFGDEATDALAELVAARSWCWSPTGPTSTSSGGRCATSRPPTASTSAPNSSPAGSPSPVATRPTTPAPTYADAATGGEGERRGLWAPDACGAGDVDGATSSPWRSTPTRPATTLRT
jgi:endonuclease YncB( thermonuclease family)